MENSIITLTRTPRNRFEKFIWNYRSVWSLLEILGVSPKSYSFSPLLLNSVGMLKIFSLFRELEIPIKELDEDYFFIKGITQTPQLAEIIASTIDSENSENIKKWIYREIKSEDITEAFKSLRSIINGYMDLSFRMYGCELFKANIEDNQI